MRYQKNDANGHRSLEIGDFDELNSLFVGTQIMLPDSNINEKLMGTHLDVKLENSRLENLFLGDIGVSYEMESAYKLNINLEISSMSVDLKKSEPS